MDYSLLYHRSIVRLLASDLATLALVVSLPVLKANISRLRKDIQAVSVAFRLHVRMLKVSYCTLSFIGNYELNWLFQES